MFLQRWSCRTAVYNYIKKWTHSKVFFKDFADLADMAANFGNHSQYWDLQLLNCLNNCFILHGYLLKIPMLTFLLKTSKISILQCTSPMFSTKKYFLIASVTSYFSRTFADKSFFKNLGVWKQNQNSFISNWRSFFWKFPTNFLTLL